MNTSPAAGSQPSFTLRTAVPAITKIPRKQREPAAWIIPANPDVYDHAAAFAEYGVITWGFKTTVHTGDVVYARVSGIGSNTIFQCVVERVRVPEKEVIASEFWKQPFWYDLRKQYVNLRLIDSASGEGLTYKKLNAQGLNSTNQAQEGLVGRLKTYIETFFETAGEAEVQEHTNRISRYTSGDGVTQALAALSNKIPPKRFERIVQTIARNSKIAHLVKENKHYICEICDRKPFVQKNGQPYAEADHIRPLGGNTKGLDSPENIRCLCAQCHAIITYGSDNVVKEILRNTRWQS